MNEKLKELAEQAGYYLYDLTQEHGIKTVESALRDEWVTLEKFYELVRQDERELCAKLCEQEHDNFLRDEEPDRADGAMWCAAAIRGRTE